MTRPDKTQQRVNANGLALNRPQGATFGRFLLARLFWLDWIIMN